MEDKFKPWGGHRYYPISCYYKQKFKEKVFKVSVTVSKTCPVRLEAPCIFCDKWGSSAYHLENNLPLVQQIKKNKEKIRKRYKSNKFLVYFQSYTNTSKDFALIEKGIGEALIQPEICGVILATRPDSINNRVVKSLAKFSVNTYISVEFGVQSFFDEDLIFLKRGHNVKDSIGAIKEIGNIGIDVCVHLIFGLGESEEKIIETAKIVNALPVKSVKLHNLHVLKNTALHEYYNDGKFVPLKLDDYANRVILFLSYLSPKISVQRLAAVANRWDDLIAPMWTKEKMRPIQYIEDLLKKRGLSQGVNYC